MTGVEVIAAVGAGLGAISQISQAKAASNQAKFEAEVAEQQAQRERDIAAREAQDFERDQSKLQARDRALRAASGIDVGSGTPLLVDRDTSTEIELGKKTIESGGAARATRLEQEASLFRTSAKNKQRAGFFKAGNTLLTGAAKGFG